MADHPAMRRRLEQITKVLKAAALALENVDEGLRRSSGYLDHVSHMLAIGRAAQVAGLKAPFFGGAAPGENGSMPDDYEHWYSGLESTARAKFDAALAEIPSKRSQLRFEGFHLLLREWVGTAIIATKMLPLRSSREDAAEMLVPFLIDARISNDLHVSGHVGGGTVQDLVKITDDAGLRIDEDRARKAVSRVLNRLKKQK
jgi:hypothetical protein